MMTITDTLPRAASALRAHRRAATTDSEAAEFVPYSDRQARALARALSRAIAGEVRFSAGDRALYSTDASNYRQVPIGVVVPKSIEDVIATMALCREHGAPLLSRGGAAVRPARTSCARSSPPAVDAARSIIVSASCAGVTPI